MGNRFVITELFDRDVKTIGKHINNALREELSNQVVVAPFATTTMHGAIAGKIQKKIGLSWMLSKNSPSCKLFSLLAFAVFDKTTFWCIM